MLIKDDNVTVVYRMPKSSATAIQCFADRVGKKPGLALSDAVLSGGFELYEFFDTYRPTPELEPELTQVPIKPTNYVTEKLQAKLDELGLTLAELAYSYFDMDIPPEIHDKVCTHSNGVPFVNFEGTDGLYYSLGLAHPALCSVAKSQQLATELAQEKLDYLLTRRNLSIAELSVARLFTKATQSASGLTAKDAVVSLGNAITNAMLKYNNPAPESSVILACQVLLATTGLDDATYSFAKSHIARSVHSTSDIETFVKTRQ